MLGRSQVRLLQLCRLRTSAHVVHSVCYRYRALLPHARCIQSVIHSDHAPGSEATSISSTDGAAGHDPTATAVAVLAAPCKLAVLPSATELWAYTGEEEGKAHRVLKMTGRRRRGCSGAGRSGSGPHTSSGDTPTAGDDDIALSLGLILTSPSLTSTS